jgi:hypothetical protein
VSAIRGFRLQAEESPAGMRPAFASAWSTHTGRRLWQRYGYERVLRDEMERALAIRYVVANPVRAGLVCHPREYPYLGSRRCTFDELLQVSEYSAAFAAGLSRRRIF